MLTLQTQTHPCAPPWQDACGGAQPLVTLWEGRDLRFGACVVDVQSATLTLASWQVGSQGSACCGLWWSGFEL